MLFLLALPIFFAVAEMHRYLALYAPSNILIRRARTSQPRWRTAAALAALMVGLILLMRVVEIGIGAGAPRWLSVVALVLAWDAIKLGLSMVPVVLRCLWRSCEHLQRGARGHNAVGSSHSKGD